MKLEIINKNLLLFIILILLTYLSEQVACFPTFVVPFPGLVDFVLETLTFSFELLA